jgi:hypothetical protein
MEEMYNFVTLGINRFLTTEPQTATGDRHTRAVVERCSHPFMCYKGFGVPSAESFGSAARIAAFWGAGETGKRAVDRRGRGRRQSRRGE